MAPKIPPTAVPAAAPPSPSRQHAAGDDGSDARKEQCGGCAEDRADARTRGHAGDSAAAVLGAFLVRDHSAAADIGAAQRKSHLVGAKARAFEIVDGKLGSVAIVKGSDENVLRVS